MSPASPVETTTPPSPPFAAGRGEPVIDLVRRRYSCRRYRPEAIPAPVRMALGAGLDAIRTGLFGSAVRLRLLSAAPEDPSALRGLGTYGFIRGATAFSVGAVARGARDLEDFGHAMERAVLDATALGLGTCWLGGSFTKSRFARAIEAAPGEIVPAVAAVGLPKVGSDAGAMRVLLNSRSRLPWERLFYDESFSAPLIPDRAGAFAGPLEAVRLAPSASNKQPWRILRRGPTWHFYLQRTSGYGRGTLLFRLLGLADLQRVDLGIAMSHFDLAVKEAGRTGRWVVAPPPLETTTPSPEYVASWVGRDG